MTSTEPSTHADDSVPSVAEGAQVSGYVPKVALRSMLRGRRRGLCWAASKSGGVAGV